MFLSRTTKFLGFPSKRTVAVHWGYLFVVTCFALPLSGQCPGTNEVVDPPPFQWTFHPVTANNPEAYYSGVLEFGEATFIIGGETFTTRAYRQAGGSYSIPGPTMTVVPGNKYVLRFHNRLPYEPPSSDQNVFKDPNISNVHTHGLHISGESPGDDATRVIEGSYGGDFVYDLTATHMGGTHWYHAHHHGSTYLHVAGGAFGMLIIDDSSDGLPANVDAMTERQFVLGFLDSSAAGTGGDTLMGGTLSPTWTVNGLVDGNICMPPDTWQHWRLLVADADARDKSLQFGPECEVVLLARDGVWRTSAPKAVSNNEISLTGGSRADFAVRCSGNSQLSVDGNVVANIFTEGAPDPSVHPYDTDGVSMWSAVRPNYLRDLRNEINVVFDSVSMGARTINGDKFDADVPTFTRTADAVQQWSLSGANNHPFHLHIYHVQALTDAGDFEAGEYYDVVSKNIDVRFDLNEATADSFMGRTLLHCHVLDHEDRGAMGWLDVVGGAPPPTFPVDGDLPVPYSEYYSLDAPATVPANNLIVLRGNQTGGTLADTVESDNSYLSFRPGLTLNLDEAPVQLVFEANLPSDSPTTLELVMESQANTPGLTATLAAWNWNSNDYEIVDESAASYNNDAVVTADLTSGITDYVQSGTGAVRARVVWRQAGILLFFPWQISVDQFVWEVNQ